MRTNKEYILSKAFEQYLEHGYAGVSISLLQKQLNMGRATLYYYFKDKDSLFHAILDKYIIAYIQEQQNFPDTISLKELIEKRIDMISRMQESITKLQNPKVNLSNFFSLLLYAYLNYPDFRAYIQQSQIDTQLKWKVAIENSIRSGELKANTNAEMLSRLFSNIKNGYESAVLSFNEPELYRTTCLYLYDFVKQSTH